MTVPSGANYLTVCTVRRVALDSRELAVDSRYLQDINVGAASPSILVVGGCEAS